MSIATAGTRGYSTFGDLKAHTQVVGCGWRFVPAGHLRLAFPVKSEPQSPATSPAASEELRSAVLRLRQTPRQLLFGVGLMLASGLLGTVLVRGESPSAPVLRLVHDVSAGSAVTAADFESVLLPERLGGEWLTLADLSAAAIASRPLRAGELAYKSDVNGLVDDRPSVAVAVARAQLPAGIRVGADLELWSSSPDVPQLLSSSATVRALGEDEASRVWTLTLAVEHSALPGVLGAMAGDGLTLVALP